MKNKRRDFLKYTGLAGLSLASNSVLGRLGAEVGDPVKLNQKAFFSQDNLQKQFRINDQIKADFEMAKNILKPTQKQLEHGLELHKNSLVIDAYGFMPRAAYNGELINTALNAKASSLEVQDMQEDMSMTRFVLDKKEREEFENAWEASGVTCIIQNAG